MSGLKVENINSGVRIYYEKAEYSVYVEIKLPFTARHMSVALKLLSDKIREKEEALNDN